MAYSKILRRLREEKTNYKKRGTMLMGKRDFITVNITNENTQVQILKPGMVVTRLSLLHILDIFLKKDGKVLERACTCSISNRIFGR